MNMLWVATGVVGQSQDLRRRSPTNGSVLIAFSNIRPMVLPPCEKTSAVCESLQSAGMYCSPKRLPAIGGASRALLKGDPLAMASRTRFP